jgi:drug/metabolite transporter (DMT)-like permease
LVRLVALAALWGSGFLWIKIALRGLNPSQIVLAQLVAGAAVLLVVVAVKRQRMPRAASTWVHLVVMAVVANIAPYLLFTWGEQRVSSGLAGTLNATTPLFTMVLVLATGWERLPLIRASGLLLGFAGVVVLAAPWHNSSSMGSLIGVGACLLAAACYGVSYVYARRFLVDRDHPPLVLAAGQLGTGALLLGLVAPAVAAQPTVLTGEVVGSVLVLGVLSTGIAYVLNYRLIADEGATVASTVTYLIPVVALLLGAVVLGEPLAWHLLVGALVVLGGVALSEGRLSAGSRRGTHRREADLDRTR